MPGSVLALEIKKRDPFTSQSEEVYLNLLRTHAVLSAPSEQMFKTHGISPPKYNILRILRGAVRNNEGCNHGLPSLEIAERMITRVPDITRLVDGLIEDGLVARTRCTEDRRVVYVGITPKGLDLLGQLDEPIAELFASLLSHLTPDELLELNRLLVKARKVTE
jgi:DNA-binding MarR family transcriptional regulator